MKLYCIFAKDIITNVPAGKLCGQAGHAFEGALLNSNEEIVNEYLDTEDKIKIVVVIKNLSKLLQLQEAYKAKGVGTHLVTDKGYTVFKEPTITCLGLGPIREEQIGTDLKRLRLLG